MTNNTDTLSTASIADLYRNLYEKSGVSSGNMSVIVGLYGGYLRSLLVYSDSLPKHFIEQLDKALTVGEYIWANRGEREWTAEEVTKLYNANPAWMKEQVDLYQKNLYNSIAEVTHDNQKLSRERGF